MRKSTYFLLIFISISWTFWACGGSSSKPDTQDSTSTQNQDSEPLPEEKELENYPKFKRIVCLGERVIEAVYALGDSSKIVAIDRSYEAFPYLDVPKVGYKSTLRANYILKHKPDAVFMEAGIADDVIIRKLKAKNIPCFVFEEGRDLESAKNFVEKISKRLSLQKQGQKIIEEIEEDFQEVKKILKKRKDSLRVLYVHARGPQALMFAGVDTPTHGLITLSGAKDAASDYVGMERLSQDEMTYLNPDFILLSQKSLDSFDGKIYEALPLTSANAYRMGRVIILEESELLNFGVNTGKAARKIAEKLYKQQVYMPLPIGPQYGESETPLVTKPSEELEIIENND